MTNPSQQQKQQQDQAVTEATATALGTLRSKGLHPTVVIVLVRIGNEDYVGAANNEKLMSDYATNQTKGHLLGEFAADCAALQGVTGGQVE